MPTLSKIDHILSLIEDGAWHSLESLSKHSDIPKQKLEQLSKILSETNIVEFGNKKERIRISKEWQGMLKNMIMEQNWKRAATGTIVLPPKRSVNIQGISLTNLTEKELELSMRIKKRLEEIAIGVVA